MMCIIGLLCVQPPYLPTKSKGNNYLLSPYIFISGFRSVRGCPVPDTFTQDFWLDLAAQHTHKGAVTEEQSDQDSM